jgi:hypothetical protein
MDTFMKLPRDLRIILGASVIYLVLSFLDWQQVCVGGAGFKACGGVSEWHGIGVLGGLFVVALLAWEVVRLLDVKLELGSLSPALISLALALGLLVLTVITFLSHSAFRHWPEWVALILSFVIAGFAVRRARGEGVDIPEFAPSRSMRGPGASSPSHDTTPNAPASAPEPEPPPDASPEGGG